MTTFIVEKAVAEKFKVGLYYYPPEVDDINTIVGASATVAPYGLVLDGQPIITGSKVMQMVHGGIAGATYTVQFTVVTLDGSNYASPNHDAIIVKVI